MSVFPRGCLSQGILWIGNGVARMTSYLRYELGYAVNEKRIRRLYRQMGLQTVYPKPNLSKKERDSFIYPYLLKNRKATKPNQIWQTDITYITMRRGFMYAKGIPLGYDSHNRCI